MLGVVSAKQRGVSHVFISSSLRGAWGGFVLLALIPNSLAAVDILTQHKDAARMGANLNETLLTPANVNASGFEKIFSHAVDGYVYAQPLLLSGLVISGKGTHNALCGVQSGSARDAESAGLRRRMGLTPIRSDLVRTSKTRRLRAGGQRRCRPVRNSPGLNPAQSQF